MTAPTITSARAPEPELSHGSVNEPSMEDILASIRRIIAEDQSTSLTRGSLSGLTRRAPPQTPPVEHVATAQAETFAEASTVPAEVHAAESNSDRDVYDAPSGPIPDFAPDFHVDETVVQQHVEPGPELDHVEPAAVSMHPAPMQPELAQSEFDGEPLISPVVGASISSSFQTLAESVMLQDPGLIERVMRESMRPLLKAWLDDHLPSIVERLVRAEIERVARGGRARNT